MYICEYCGKTTEEIETRIEVDDFSHAYNHELGRYEKTESFTTDTCEHCGGEFVEAKKCLICEDWISEYGDAICESCFE